MRLSAFITALAVTSPSVLAADFNSNNYYRLSNTYLGRNTALDVVNDAGFKSSGTLQMATKGNFSGQFWRFWPSPDETTYTLSTQFLGVNMALEIPSMTVIPKLSTRRCGDAQSWRVEKWGDGTWRISNVGRGTGFHLDTYSDTHEPFLGDGNHSGQHWYIDLIGPV